MKRNFRNFITYQGIRICVAALSMVEATVAEEDRTQGWYAGIGVSAGNVFAVESNGYLETSERGNSDTGFAITGGYRLNRHLAFEIGYLDGGAPTFSSILTQACSVTGPCLINLEQATTAVEVGVVGILPIRDIWEIYMKGGAALWEAHSSQVIAPLVGGNSTSRHISADGTDFMLAIGAGVTVGDHSQLRLEYLAFRTDDDLLALDSNREARFDLIAIKWHWRY